MEYKTAISLLALHNSLIEKCYIEMAIADGAQAQLYTELARKCRENKALLNNLEVKPSFLLEPETKQCFENLVREMITKVFSNYLSNQELQALLTLVRPEVEIAATEEEVFIPAVTVAANSKDNQIATTYSHKKGYTKSPRTNLSINFENGPLIHRSTAKEGFVAALEFMGLERVKSCGLMACGEPLVSETLSKKPKYASQQAQSGKYYIFTSTATEKKKSDLEKLARMLEYKVQVEVV